MEFALRANVKDGDRDGGGKENWDVDQDGSEPARLRSACRRMQQHAERCEQQVSEIGNKMAGRLHLDRHRQLTSPNFGQQFFAGLDRTFGPAMLLGFETVHVDWQFRWSHNIGQEDKSPAGKLSAIAQIEVLSQSI